MTTSDCAWLYVTLLIIWATYEVWKEHIRK